MFLIAVEEALNRVNAVLWSVNTPARTILMEIREAYVKAVEMHRNEIILQVQAYGINDVEVRQVVSVGIGQTSSIIRAHLEKTRVKDIEDQVSSIMANQFLLQISTMLAMPELINGSKI